MTSSRPWQTAEAPATPESRLFPHLYHHKAAKGERLPLSVLIVIMSSLYISASWTILSSYLPQASAYYQLALQGCRLLVYSILVGPAAETMLWLMLEQAKQKLFGLPSGKRLQPQTDDS